MTDFSEFKRADMRLVMLRAIEDDGYSLNESLLQDVLRLFGHTVSRDQVKTEVRWLEEQGLANVETVAGVLVVRLTGRGVDAANGVAHVDGVKRPRPK